MTQTPTNRERLDKATITLGTMLEYLGLKASVKGDEKDGRLLLTVFSEDAGRIIGRKGQTLNCLLLLLNRMLQRNDPDCKSFHIDVDGYERKDRRGGGGPRNGDEDETAPPGNRRDEPMPGQFPGADSRGNDRRGGGRRDGRGGDRRGGGRDRGRGGDRGPRREGGGDRGPRREGGGERRDERPPARFDEERLRQQALDTAKEVKRWGDDVTLPPMGPRERRVIHVTLQDDPEVTSSSVESGRGDLKQVIVALKKKD
jgi:predicted RNA-binding protein Jag